MKRLFAHFATCGMSRCAGHQHLGHDESTSSTCSGQLTQQPYCIRAVVQGICREVREAVQVVLCTKLHTWQVGQQRMQYQVTVAGAAKPLPTNPSAQLCMIDTPTTGA
jgi:hypothetical protein